MHRMTAVALALTFALPAAAQKTDAEARARAIAPFLEGQTVAVAHVDLTRIDADALFGAVAAAGKEAAEEVEGPRRELRGWLAGLTRAGGKDLYLVVSLADLPVAPPFVVVPLPDGADAGAVGRELTRGKPFENLHTATLGQAVVAGSESTLRRLRSLQPTPRPEVAQAFAAAGDAAVQVVFVPTPDTRRVIDELLPTLPSEVGGGPSTTLTHGLSWAALGVQPPPKLALRLLIQSPDADAAGKLAEFLGRAREALARQDEVRELLPDFPRLVALLTPQTEGNRLTVSLGDRELAPLVPSVVKRALQAADRRTVMARLKGLAIGMHNYVDAGNGRLPAVANFDKQGRPLLSWRVHLLPYVGEAELYKEFHLDEPWDSPHNKPLLARMPAAYQGPSRKLNREGKTIYLAPVGKHTAFTGAREGRRFPAEFTDGTSNTILLVEGDDEHAVPWTRPEDLTYDPEQPHRGLGGHFPGGFLVALADGSVRFLRPSISKETLRAAFTVDGGEVLGPDW